MPPKRSLCSRHPSAAAINAAASGESKRKRARTTKQKTPVPPVSVPPVPVPVPQRPVTVPPVPVPPVGQEIAFPPGLMDNLVARVADEVPRRLTPVYAAASSTVAVTQPPEAPPVPVTDGLTEEMPIVGNLANLIDQSITSAQSPLSGEPNPVIQKALPEHLFSSPSLAIDSRVSEKLKLKIWSNEYFEFSALLSNPVFESKYHLTINNSDSGLAPSFCLEPVSKTKKYISIESWLNCFHIFVGVYTRKYPTEAPALMKYGEVVQDLAARGHNWRFYDENLRFMRQSQPASFPWFNIHWELWMRSQQPSVRKPTATAPPNQSTNRDDSLPKGYCFKFIKGLKCSGCAFKHLCYKCEGSHQPRLCNFRPQSGTSNNDSRPAKSQFNKAQPAKS